ncbi:ABC transporter substrate-binding protein [Paenibacillus sp. GCM10023252]|uniref:ABC transporter substrate-binding protein n=1 Tax=Paenibacillus sp. GCM10023252 TaxID=3252649 RepID=UPI00360D35AC
MQGSMGWSKTRKAMSVMLVTATAFSTLVACSGNNGGNGGNGGNNGNGGNGEAAAVSEGFTKGKFDPLVEISTFQCNNNLPFRDGESIEDNVHTRWAKEKLGIQITYDWTTSPDQCTNKIRLAMAGNQQLPDVMMIGDKQILGELIEAGKVMDITEAFDKYASEQVKTIYGADPTYWYGVSKDGKRYGLPILSESMNNDPLLYIRQDWLDQMSMKAPTNFDELEKVMEGMKKLGKPAPLALGLKNDVNPFATYMTDASWIFGGYGAIPGYWNTWTDKGTLEYGSIQPEVKEALAKMQDWFKKGYLSQDIGLLDERKGSEQFTSEQSGIIAGPIWMYGWPIQATLLKNNPKAVIAPVTLPAGPSGKVGRHGTTIPGQTLVVRKGFEHTDALFLYLNELFKHSNPEAGSPYENGWHEGYDYVMKDGKVSRVREDFPNAQPISVSKHFITSSPMIDPALTLEMRRKFYNGEKPTTPVENQWYNSAKPEEQQNPKTNKGWQAVDVMLQQADTSKQDLFLGAPTKTMISKSEALRKLEQETFISIIYNKAPVSDFDKFVEKWKSSGGDEITAEVNEWFKSATAK